MEAYHYNFGTFDAYDWQTPSDLASLTKIGEDFVDSTRSVSQYYTMSGNATLVALMQAAVNAGDPYFYIMIASANTRTSTPPSTSPGADNEDVIFGGAAASDGYRVKLQITYNQNSAGLALNLGATF
jgi:hypothetical protein